MQNGQEREILKKGQFYIEKSSFLEGKTYKISIFLKTIWIGIKSLSITQNAVKTCEIIPSYIENCYYNAVFGQKLWTKMYRGKKQRNIKPCYKVGQLYKL